MVLDLPNFSHLPSHLQPSTPSVIIQGAKCGASHINSTVDDAPGELRLDTLGGKGIVENLIGPWPSKLKCLPCDHESLEFDLKLERKLCLDACHRPGSDHQAFNVMRVGFCVVRQVMVRYPAIANDKPIRLPSYTAAVKFIVTINP